MYGVENRITYSILMSHINRAIINLNADYTRIGHPLIVPDQAQIGLFVCRSPTEYSSAYPNTISNFKYRQISTVYPAATISEEEDVVSVPFLLHNRRQEEWTEGLARIRNVGCAFNVLSYYGIIPKNDAREQAVCLPAKGTSIFRIIDMINELSPDMIGTGRMRAYQVIRYTLDLGLEFLYDFISGLSPVLIGVLGEGIIFKMYDDLLHQGNDSHFGHTVSLLRDREGIHFIDPQTLVSATITTSVELITRVRELYASKNYIDIIWGILSSDTDFAYGIDSPIQRLLIQPFKTRIREIPGASRIIQRRPDINFGGGRKKKSTKSKKGKKAKSVKNQEDPYIKLVKCLDKTNHIPTTIKSIKL